MKSEGVADASLPSWLSRSEGYTPGPDRDRFIEQSILGLLGTLTQLRSRPGSGIARARLNPALKLVAVFTFILLVGLSTSRAFLELAATCELVCLALLGPQAIARVLEKGLAAAAFAFVILLPSALGGNWAGLFMTGSKVLMAVIAAALLSATSPWQTISRGLGSLRLPDLFILVLDLAIKYVSLLGGMVLDMLYALKLRSVGRNEDKRGSLTGVAGTLFLKSREAAEELHAAMRCRGFDGSYRPRSRRTLSRADLGFLVFVLALVTACVLLRGSR